ncbi:MAG: protein kinase [Planctomycetota bacterium]
MPRIYIENGPDRGKSFIIRQEGPFFAGRDAAAQVPIRDEMASRRHFQIDVRDGTFQIRDLDSKNYTYLNGARIRKVEPLAANDRIQVGSTILTFLDDQQHPLIGQEIAGYRILDLIGRGGMGTVYRALKISLDRVVALKILAPHLVKNTSFINLFIQEARAAGALSHPNIVQVYDVGVEEEVYYFSMEYIPGGSVEDILNRDGAIGLPRALEVVRDSARGLEYAEQKGIIHRDIKPGNLMVGQGGIVKIGDLGIAKSTQGAAQISQTDGVSGSPHYIAPEQAQGEDIDHRVDLYSLGVSFYQMLCGRTPFSGSSPREVILHHIKSSPPALAERAPSTPVEVVWLVERLMEKKPTERIPSASALLRELEPLITRHREGHPVGGGGRRRFLGRLLPLLTGALLLVALSIGGGVLYREYRKSRDREAQELADLSALLDRVAAAMDDGDAHEAGSLLDDLSGRALSPLLGERRAALRVRYEQYIAREEEAARRSLAERELEAILEGQPEVPGEKALADLRAFAEEHPDTPAARRASRRADEIEGNLQALREHDAAAAGQLRSLLARARGYEDASNFAKARDTLLEFEEGFHDTPAAGEQRRSLEALQSRAEAAWRRVATAITEDLAASRLIEAHDRAARFARIAGFPELTSLVEARAREIREEQERRLRQAPGEGPRHEARVLGEALQSAWERWATTLEIGGAVLVLRDIGLRTLLRPPTLRSLDEHLEFLQAWEEVLSEMVTAQRPPLPIELPEGGGESIAGDVVRILPARVYLRSPGSAHERYLKWTEIPSEARLRILKHWATEPRQQLYVGFLARVSGLADLARELWTPLMDPASPFAAELEALESLLLLSQAKRD